MKVLGWLIITLIFLLFIGLARRWSVENANLLGIGFIVYMAVSFLWGLRGLYRWVTRPPHP